MVSLLSVLSAGTCLLTAMGFFARRWWVCELAVHFRVQYVVVLAACSAGWLAAGYPVEALIAGALAAANVRDVQLMYRRRAPATAGGPVVRLLMMNVNTVNQQYHRAISLARQLQPDILIVIETGQAWVDRLRELQDAYPFMDAAARDDGFGITLFSRLPVEHHEVIPVGQAQLPCQVVRVPFGGRALTVIGVHPFAPTTPSSAAGRNEQFTELARLISRTPPPVLVMGDFNCTPWSPYFQDLLRSAKLHDSRHGFGIQPSWPVECLPLRIPIDHCLVSDGIAVRSRRIADDVASDHFPVLVECSVTA